MFIAINLVVAAVPNGLGRISLYNYLFPGRERFPYGENPSQSYNMSLFDLDAMFATHMITGGTKPVGEYRVILIGDSALWGWLLHPEQTLAGQLEAVGMTTCDGRKVHVYNLGFPTISITKDLLILDQAIDYQPDLVIWFVTLEAFPNNKQLTPPLVSNNAADMKTLILQYDLPFDPDDPTFVHTGYWNRTIVGQRRPLADLLRLQLYGILWAATGIDQTYPENYQRAQTDFEADLSFHDMQPPLLDESSLAFPILDAGMRAAGATPVLLVNEPVLISDGRNSDLRYNYFYPRWAYDQYREILAEQAASSGWDYLDLWSLVPANEFTNTPFHLTPQGESLLASQIKSSILQKACP